MYETLRYALDEGVATITLDRPDAANAFNSVMLRELLACFDATDADDAVRAVILTAEGRVFCAGADMNEGFGVGGGEGAAFRDRGGQVALRIRRSLKPVIAVINGAAAGAGAAMVLASDIRIAAAEARFLFPYVRLGLVPEGCTSWFLPRLVGVQRAMDWILRGATVEAGEALDAGLVAAVLPKDGALAEGLRRARAYAAGAPVSVALARQMLWHGMEAASPEDVHLVESRLVAHRRASADMAEGVAAFREKTTPRFPGAGERRTAGARVDESFGMTPLIRPAAANVDYPFALRDSLQVLGWNEVERLTAQAAAAIIEEVSQTPDARIAVFARNAAEPALAYIAGLRAGVSPVPINFHLTAAEAAYILADSGARLLFVGPETAATGLAAAAMVGGVRVVGWRSPPNEGLIAWNDWLAAPDAEEPLDRPARPYLHYTSGTTGRPKGAETPPAMFPQVDTVNQLFAAYRAAVEALPAGPSMIVGPMYHTGPLNSVRHVIGGKPLIVRERFDAEDLLRTIAAHGVSTVTLVPTHFQRLLALTPAVRTAHDVSSLRAVNHTGAACPPEVKRAMIDWFGPVLTESYGATEAGSMTAITSAEWLDHPGSVGRIQPGFELVVLDDDDRPIEAGKTGRLFFRDLTGRGIRYHNAAEKSAEAHVAPGVFTLGDIGHVDADGFIYITDREADMIVSGGVNIYPAEIEAVLAGAPGIADSAVIGVPDPDMGEAVKALVVPVEGAAIDPDGVIAWCRERLAGYKVPRSIDIVSNVGRNAMGKVNKRDLRGPFWPSGRTIAG